MTSKYATSTHYDFSFIPFFFSSRRRHTRYWRDWSSDVCSSDLAQDVGALPPLGRAEPAYLGAGGPAEPRRRLDRRALDPGDHLLDRPARRRLDDREVDDHDPEQGRDHEEETTCDVGEHAGWERA